MTMPPFHFETTVALSAPAEVVFPVLDDQRRLSAHMSKSSWLMAGSRMTITFDASRGQTKGAIMQLSGRVLGITLFVEEIVTEHEPPLRKVWQTTGTPRLLVIGQYRMGFEIRPGPGISQLRVFIDYALPEHWFSHAVGRLFGHFYARWCTRRIAEDAAAYFSPQDRSGEKA
jgi:hypothetical protein